MHLPDILGLYANNLLVVICSSIFTETVVAICLSIAQQPDVGQGLPSGCRHRTELTGGSRVSTTLVPTADNPGFLDQLFDHCVCVRIGG